jgi:hypothetical protein
MPVTAKLKDDVPVPEGHDDAALPVQTHPVKI